MKRSAAERFVIRSRPSCNMYASVVTMPCVCSCPLELHALCACVFVGNCVYVYMFVGQGALCAVLNTQTHTRTHTSTHTLQYHEISCSISTRILQTRKPKRRVLSIGCCGDADCCAMNYETLPAQLCGFTLHRTTENTDAKTRLVDGLDAELTLCKMVQACALLEHVTVCITTTCSRAPSGWAFEWHSRWAPFGNAINWGMQYR